MLAVLRIISGEFIARAEKKMAAFSLRLDLAIEVNRHFLEKEYGDLSNLSNCFEFRNKFLYVK